MYVGTCMLVHMAISTVLRFPRACYQNYASKTWHGLHTFWISNFLMSHTSGVVVTFGNFVRLAALLGAILTSSDQSFRNPEPPGF